MHGKIIADLRILSQSSAPLIQSEAVPESDKLSLMCALMQCYENLSAESVDIFMFIWVCLDLSFIIWGDTSF